MQDTATADWTHRNRIGGWSTQRRNLAGACLAHLLHDGYTDQLYALLPIWQPEFGLSYAGLALVRALYSGTAGGLQVPADKLAAKLSPRVALALATFTAAAGYLVMALPLGFVGLCVGLIIAGIGSSVQHPRASTLVTNSYGKTARGPLSIYNFSGDLGKATFPAFVALLLPLVAWRPVVGLMALIGLVVAFALLALVPQQPAFASAETETDAEGQDGRGFNLLLTVGAFDTATRMGYLLFLPFLFHAKGGNETSVGIGLALLFAGGALGKACCGWLGQHLGVVWSVIVTEAATALFMVATLMLPLGPMLVLLPLLGVVLNGTSSVLYGTVPELARKGEVGRAFALFYTGVMGAGGLAPIAYGALADHSSRTIGVAAAALTAAAIIPMILALRPFLREGRAGRSDDGRENSEQISVRIQLKDRR
jgi:FSR family fosmidomycin resistance protein-like MFS transporter